MYQFQGPVINYDAKLISAIWTEKKNFPSPKGL